MSELSILGNLELHLLEISQRHPTLHPKNFNADNLALLVVVEHDTGLHLFRFDDLGFIQTQIQRIGLFVEMYFHMRRRPDSSKTRFDQTLDASTTCPRRKGSDQI